MTSTLTVQTGRMAWPVRVVRVRVVVVGFVVLSRSPVVRPEHYFWLIVSGMVVQALASGAAIRFVA